MPLDLDWNDTQILADAEEAFYQANEHLGDAFTRQISSNTWQWPTQPSPRNIVDTGELRRSYAGERTRHQGDPAFDHSWNIDYALAVHNGAVFDHGGTMTARPWTLRPLGDGTLEAAYERLAKLMLGRIQ